MSESEEKLKRLHSMPHAEALKVLVGEPFAVEKWHISCGPFNCEIYSRTMPDKDEAIDHLAVQAGRVAASYAECGDSELNVEWIPY